MTSNLGFSKQKHLKLVWRLTKHRSFKAVEKFNNEFRNRLDAVIRFNKLDES